MSATTKKSRTVEVSASQFQIETAIELPQIGGFYGPAIFMRTIWAPVKDYSKEPDAQRNYPNQMFNSVAECDAYIEKYLTYPRIVKTVPS